MTLKRIATFLERYVLRHPLYVLVYAWGYVSSKFALHVRFYDDKGLQNLLGGGKSLIRLGDGEINLLLDLHNHYHAFSPMLQKMVRSVIRGYSTESAYALSVPRFLSVANSELEKMGKKNVWMPFKAIYVLLFPKNVSYMDAHSFYYDGFFERIVAPLFLDKTVIIVTNKKTIQKQKENPRLPWKEVRYVETPEEDALESYDAIVASVDAELLSYADPKSVVLFFAFGPVGKYMLKQYSELGYQALDTGKVTEVMFTGESIEWMI